MGAAHTEEKMRRYILLLLFFSLSFTILIAEEDTMNKKDIIIPIGVGAIGTTLIVSHLIAPETYNPLEHTISQLAAQNYDYAHIMRIGLFSLGSTTAISSVKSIVTKDKTLYQTIPMLLYGSSIMMSSFFSAAPFEADVSYSKEQSDLHSIFATTAGFAFTGAMISSGIVEKKIPKKILHFAGSLFVLGVSSLIGIYPEYAGLWQRVLWTGSLAWLTFAY